MLEKLKKWWTLDEEEEAKSEDSSMEPVPWSKRRGALSLIVLSFGWGFCTTGLVCGGQVVDGSNFGQMMGGLIAGDLILFVISILVCIIAYRTGCCNALIYRFVFGNKLWIIPSIMVVIMGLGHQALMSGMIGDVIVGMDSSIYWLVCLIGGLAVIITVYCGIKGVEVIGNVAVFFLTIAMIVMIVYNVKYMGGWSGVIATAAEVGTGQKSTAALIDIAVGAWSVGAAFAGDFTRFAKQKWVIPAFVAINFLVVQPLLQLLGLLGQLAFQDYTFTNYAWNLGKIFGVIAFIAMIFAMWTTANSNLYFITQAGANVLRRPTKAVATLLGTIGAIGAAVGFYGMVGGFIDFLASIVPPLVGVVIADYYIVNGMKYDPRIMKKVADFNILALISYFVGVIFPRFYKPAAIPLSVWGIFVSAVFYTIIMLIAKSIGAKQGYLAVANEGKGPWDPKERAMAELGK